MSAKTFVLIPLFAFIVFSCDTEIASVDIPQSNDTDYLDGVQPYTDFIKTGTEGIYKVTNGQDAFGDYIVAKWSGSYLSLFAGRNTAYLILEGGSRDSTLRFEGYWRFAQDSKTGLVRLEVQKQDGAAELLRGEQPDRITFTGEFGDGDEIPSRTFTITYERPIAQSEDTFWIIGHRGGGRNLEHLPASENSVEMILYSERLGANAIEIDVQCTKDNIPVLYHDRTLNSRLINEDYFTGKISDYTLAQLKTFCTLKNGERIPTLHEALETVINNTELKLVWLDIKAKGIVGIVSAVQREFQERANQQGRDLELIFGIPDKDIYHEYLALEESERTPALCELDEEHVRESGSIIWAPRWSLGLLNDRIEVLKSDGIRAFAWTLDVESLIHKFMSEGNYDGMVTNYPTVVAYDYYIR